MGSMMLDHQLKVGFTIIFVAISIALIIIGIEDPILAIKGSYSLIGLLIGMAIFFLKDRQQDENSWRFSSDNLVKIITMVYFLSVFAVIAGVRRNTIVFLVLPFVTSCLVLLLLSTKRPSYILSGTIMTFLINPSTKTLTTGVYFGNGDLIKHSLFTNQVVQAGQISAISSPTYKLIPGLHLLTASISIVNDFATNGSLPLVGLAVYPLFIIFIFVVIDTVSDRDLAAVTSVMFALLPTTQFYATYFFPQSLGIIYMFILLSLVIISGTKIKNRVVLIAVLLSVVAVFEHHFTILVFTFFYALLYTISSYLGKEEYRQLPTAMFLVSLIGVSYWTATGFFIGGLSLYIGRFIKFLGFGSTGETTSAAIRFGTNAPEETLMTAFLSLFSSLGVYHISLFSLVVLSWACLLTLEKKHTVLKPLLYIGALGTLFFVKTPIAIIGNQRLQHLFSPFVATFLAIGISKAIYSRNKGAKSMMATLLIIFSFGSGFIAADDVYYDNDQIRKQVEFTTSEWHQLEEIRSFQRNSEMTALWISREAMKYHGSTQLHKPLQVTKDGIRIKRGLFLVRGNWVDHKVISILDRTRSISISNHSLKRTSRMNSKVYTSGDVYALWKSEEGTIFNDQR